MGNDKKIIMYDVKKGDLSRFKPEVIYEKMYVFEIKVPTKQQVSKYINSEKANDKIVKFFKSDIDNGIDEIKKMISMINIKLPLYDVYTENLYLVSRNNIYERVINKFYRFPNDELLKNLDEKREMIEKELIKMKNDEDYEKIEEIETKSAESDIDITKIDEEIYRKFQDKRILVRKLRKIRMIVEFMSSFDSGTLYNTYVNAFYSYSNEFGKNLTLCVRPSFSYYFKHIKPYYTRAEIINIALNMEIIREDDTVYDKNKINSLCRAIKENDIDSKILLEHQVHIIKHKMIGLVQYYSMQGSYFINQYLRGTSSHNYRDVYLENLIEPMCKLVQSAPKFNKSYTVYRFIEKDDFLQDLKIGDTYTEKGFMSTTRDPFYQNDVYKFGWIILKIKLPEKKTGVALCIETNSSFPNEQEIILPPNTMLKLLRKNDKKIYYHIDKNVNRKLQTMYEFEVVGDDKIYFPEKDGYDEKINVVDFLKIDTIESLTVGEKIQNFVNKYVSPMGIFDVNIGNDIYHVKSEWYDSSNVYKKFYAATTKNGYSLYCMHDNHMLFNMEIGDEYGTPYIYANYYVKYTTPERQNIVNSEKFIEFLASVSYYFGINVIYLYSDYISCDYIRKIDFDKKQAKFGGIYCNDFYEYLKYGKRKYSDLSVLNIEMIPKFKYHLLDILKKTNPEKVIKRIGENNTDDQIYQIYDKTYRDYVPEASNNLADFYVWMVENNCFLLDDLVDKFKKIPEYRVDNPFKNDYYIFDACGYLYNRNKINVIPQSITNIQSNIKLDNNTDSKRYSNTNNRVRDMNEYRLNKR